LSRRDCSTSFGWPAGPGSLRELECTLLIVGVLWTVLWKKRNSLHGHDWDPPFRDGLPMTPPERGRCHTGLPVAGSSLRSEPLYAVPPIVVLVPATKRFDPFQMADARHASFPCRVPAETRNLQTGPAARFFSLNAE
jgi:hypothetical protein